MADLADKLNGLAALPPAALRPEWRRLYREPAPELSPDLLVRGIAWRLQEKQLGGLAPAVKRELARSAEHGAPPSEPGAPASVSLRPGTRLVRSWNGQTYSVLVTGDGYRMGDQTYASLSSIARAITGTKWSGPRFFGLKSPAPAREGAMRKGEKERSRVLRCAIYTRKSTEDGLEQEFNSLDAQREACAAYIASQRHEGWTLVPDHYDDGGFSGGTMDRRP